LRATIAVALFHYWYLLFNQSPTDYSWFFIGALTLVTFWLLYVVNGALSTLVLPDALVMFSFREAASLDFLVTASAVFG